MPAQRKMLKLVISQLDHFPDRIKIFCVFFYGSNRGIAIVKSLAAKLAAGQVVMVLILQEEYSIDLVCRENIRLL